MKRILLLFLVGLNSAFKLTALSAISLQKMKIDGCLSGAVLRELQKTFGVSVFIESGTYIGDTAAVASQFFEVHTIELSKMLFEKAKKRFEYNSKIHLHYGDSAQVLPTLLRSISGKILFWLDGHWSAGNTAKGESVTPILQELDCIKASGITDALLLVDDIRYFQPPIKDASGTSVEGYPDLPVLIQKIKNINNDYRYYVLGDTLIAYLSSYDVTVSPVVEACTVSRCFDGANVSLSKLLEAEATIAHARGQERQELTRLVKDFTYNAEGEFGSGRYYHLWRGLTLLKSNPQAALKAFENAIATGLNHWRIWWYRTYATEKLGNKIAVTQAIQDMQKNSIGWDTEEALLATDCFLRVMNK